MTHEEQAAFDIISAAGDGREKVMAALKQARKGNFGVAADELKDADVYLLKAHQIQTDELITKQANGELTEPYNVVIAHAQDYVMTAMAMKEMAVEIVKLYEKVHAI
jgi:PTS system cellobiose-specific IIA component